MQADHSTECVWCVWGGSALSNKMWCRGRELASRWQRGLTKDRVFWLATLSVFVFKCLSLWATERLVCVEVKPLVFPSIVLLMHTCSLSHWRLSKVNVFYSPSSASSSHQWLQWVKKYLDTDNLNWILLQTKWSQLSR